VGLRASLNLLPFFTQLPKYKQINHDERKPCAGGDAHETDPDSRPLFLYSANLRVSARRRCRRLVGP
jgi:hypothetical protein